MSMKLKNYRRKGYLYLIHMQFGIELPIQQFEGDNSFFFFFLRSSNIKINLSVCEDKMGETG
jgi:hypothetical protein